MSRHDNERSVHRFMVALQSGADLDELDAVCVPEVAAGWRHAMETFSFDDRTFTVDHMVSDESQVAILWSNTGTHTREYVGLRPTGIATVGSGSAFFTFVDGLITDVVSYYDAEGLFRTLGATISLPD